MSNSSKKLTDMNSDEKKIYVLENMEGTFNAIKYMYDNCDENSEFGEMIFDAYLLFTQARTGVHSLLLETSEKDDSDNQ